MSAEAQNQRHGSSYNDIVGASSLNAFKNGLDKEGQDGLLPSVISSHVERAKWRGG